MVLGITLKIEKEKGQCSIPSLRKLQLKIIKDVEKEAVCLKK